MRRINRRFILVLVFLFVVVIVSPIGQAQAAVSAPQSLTIEQALDLASKDNYDMRKSEIGVNKLEELTEKAAQSVNYIPLGGMVDPQVQQVVSNYQQLLIQLQTAKKSQTLASESVKANVINSYAQLIMARNNVKSAELSLSDMEQKMKMAKISNSIGLLSNMDLNTMALQQKVAADTLANAKLKYDEAIAELRKYLLQNEEWRPELVSIPAIEKYGRNEISIEISRGLDQSTSVFQAKQELDSVISKNNWIDTSTPYKVKQYNLSTAEINYEQAKLDVKVSIEKLYNQIDQAEKAIELAQSSYEQAERDLKLAEYKYKLGLIPKYSADASSSSSLSAAQMNLENKKIVLENARCSLIMAKAQYAILTGKTAYDPSDWVQNVTNIE